MKAILVVLALSALIAGGIYHEEVSHYVTALSGGPTQHGGSSSAVGSVKSVGSSNSSIINGIGNTLGP